MTKSSPRLSKSRFTSGLQCHKKLWWEVHERDAPELQPDKVLQDLFDQGRQVGESRPRARRDRQAAVRRRQDPQARARSGA